MSKRSFEIYQYVAPAILTPVSFWLWWRRYDADLWLTLMAWLVPIVYAYIVPAIGTNVLKVWEFDTRLRLGRFRPHHGFVFGSATAAIAWLVQPGPAGDVPGIVMTGVVFGLVLGIVNVLYDVKALEVGHLRVYNQPWAEGKGSLAVALDYAPWFFGVFGVMYGAGLGVAELLAARGSLGAAGFAWLFPATLALSIGVPLWGYRRQSYWRFGHSGCRPVARKLP